MSDNENAEAGERSAGATRSVFKVKEFILPLQMKKDLTYSPLALTDAMMTQASMFAHYGVLAADASRQVDVVKMLLETTEATIYRIERDAFALRGDKVTEAQLEKIISRNDKVLALKKALNEAKQIEAIGKVAVEAFRHRRDMLVQQGLLSREEMKGEVAIGMKAARDLEAENVRANVLEARRRRAESASAE